MARLRTLPSRVATLTSGIARAATLSDKRMAGRALQRRRLRIWSRDPHCACCGRLVDMHQFELDHIVALTNGGIDDDSNCQVMCIDCHKGKTRVDLGRGK